MRLERVWLGEGAFELCGGTLHVVGRDLADVLERQRDVVDVGRERAGGARRASLGGSFDVGRVDVAARGEVEQDKKGEADHEELNLRVVDAGLADACARLRDQVDHRHDNDAQHHRRP